MLNIELAVLQTLDREDWWTLSEISEKTKIQEQSAEEVLNELDRHGIIESRTTTSSNDSEFTGVEWRSQDNSLETYLKEITP